MLVVLLVCAASSFVNVIPAPKPVPRVRNVAMVLQHGSKMPKRREAQVARAGLAGSALLAEGVSFAGTALALSFAQQHLQASNPVETVTALIDIVSHMGTEGMAVFALTMIFLQIIPIANAFLLTLTAGAIFGVPVGAALCLGCSTIGATLSFLIARNFGREALVDVARQSKEFVAVDKALSTASFRTSLTLITLLRASPVLPFTWGNYMFGLSPINTLTFSLGTFCGCLPSIVAYVCAGQAGADIALNGAGSSNPYLLGLGVAATIGAVATASNIAKDALKGSGLE